MTVPSAPNKHANLYQSPLKGTVICLQSWTLHYGTPSQYMHSNLRICCNLKACAQIKPDLHFAATAFTIYEHPSNLLRVISTAVKTLCRICPGPADWLAGDQPCRDPRKKSKASIKGEMPLAPYYMRQSKLSNLQTFPTLFFHHFIQSIIIC